MRMYVLPLLLMLALSPTPAAPEPPAAAARDDRAADSDFQALHRQAVAAMENLRRAGEQRLAAAEVVAF